MCTVSFVPNYRGFYVAMNRDEKRTRATALAPAIVELAERRAIFPREPEGGTWIAANDSGACFALINWYRINREPDGEVVSRGQVVKTVAGASTAKEIAAGLARLPLVNLRPFRLIAIIPSSKKLIEWRWDLERLLKQSHPWKLRHWFSSGFDESTAEIKRAKICASAKRQKSKGGIAWLRQLHRSHAPEPGPFSICMHRPDAATVSYTEVIAQDRHLLMRYKPGTTCSKGRASTKSIQLAR